MKAAEGKFLSAMKISNRKKDDILTMYATRYWNIPRSKIQPLPTRCKYFDTQEK